jgi:hypothetical protein
MNSASLLYVANSEEESGGREGVGSGVLEDEVSGVEAIVLGWKEEADLILWGRGLKRCRIFKSRSYFWDIFCDGGMATFSEQDIGWRSAVQGKRNILCSARHHGQL